MSYFISCKNFQGPLIRAWFLTLEKLLGSAVTLRITFAKVVLDQLLFAPSQQTTILVTIGALQGFTLQQIKDKVRNELYTITTTGWKVLVLSFIKFVLFFDPSINSNSFQKKTPEKYLELIVLTVFTFCFFTDLAICQYAQLLLRSLSITTFGSINCEFILVHVFSI